MTSRRAGAPRRFHPVLFILGLLTLINLSLLVRFVDLKPHVDEHFFFSSNDPGYQDDKKITELFSQVPQIVLAAKGDIFSKSYMRSMEDLSRSIEGLPEVLGLQSLARGPSGPQDAIDSPLWKRVLVSEDRQASFIFVFLKKNPDTPFIEKIERIQTRLDSPEFDVMISGGPYVIELIRRYLFRDLKIFTAAALSVFSLALFIIFGSLWIVAGVIVACCNASAATLLLTKFFHLQTGFLTANLPTIVFVITLSHIAFLTAEWKQTLLREGRCRPGQAWQAARVTLQPALWSTFTALLGFGSLFFVPSTSLRQLGVSGATGTLVALAGAYLIFPWFLDHQRKRPNFFQIIKTGKAGVLSFFRKRHPLILAGLALAAVLGVWAMPRLDTDPSLFAYFREGSELRSGLEYIDQNGGSNPLNIVIEDPDREKLNDADAYKKMWKLHQALEQDPDVGNVVSLPTLLAEAKRSILARFMTTSWLLKMLESERFGEVAKYFVTKDRRQALFMLRMRETGLEEPRTDIVSRIEEIVRKQGYLPSITGGVFALQGRLSQLIASSLIYGSVFLNGVILIMTFILSRSWKTSFAMLASLYFVPITMLGFLAYWAIPLDVIAAPAANVAIGMGVDSMIHLMTHAKRLDPTLRSWQAWSKACNELWEPIMWSTLMVAAGFSIFMLSSFPPTQRFGFSVVLGTLLSPLAALFVLPWLATVKLPWEKKKVFGEEETSKKTA